MSNPFAIEGPALISFSGGRTSGMMLYRILEAHSGKLPGDVVVSFQNTGKERTETLDFVHECETRWNVPIRWIEYRPTLPLFAEVNFSTAARNGEPFTAMVRHKRYMPNPSKRLCTTELKILAAKRFARHVLKWRTWTEAIGLRVDEPARLASMRARPTPKTGCLDVVMPLADARITVADVASFWKRQPFDLQLAPGEGNCDLCFLKSTDLRLSLIRKRPSDADWWIEMERERGMPFRNASPSYAALKHFATHQQTMSFCDIDDGLGDCVCHD